MVNSFWPGEECAEKNIRIPSILERQVSDVSYRSFRQTTKRASKRTTVCMIKIICDAMVTAKISEGLIKWVHLRILRCKLMLRPR